jgi:hypothetical protein
MSFNWVSQASSSPSKANPILGKLTNEGSEPTEVITITADKLPRGLLDTHSPHSTDTQVTGRLVPRAGDQG